MNKDFRAPDSKKAPAENLVIIFLLILVLILVLAGTAMHAIGRKSNQDFERWTTWDGIFTEIEAENGWYEYGSSCARCHGENLEGGSAPTLLGEQFIENWREYTLDNMYSTIKTMPPRGPWLPARSYLNVMAYILQANGYPSGNYDLSLDTLETVWIEGKDGPQPVPDRSIVEVVGCLIQDGSKWILTKGSEPVRARKSDKATPLLLEAAQLKPLGTNEFQLQNFYMLGNFQPAGHAGHKMLAIGALNRKPSGDLISLTGLGMVEEFCN